MGDADTHHSVASSQRHPFRARECPARSGRRVASLARSMTSILQALVVSRGRFKPSPCYSRTSCIARRHPSVPSLHVPSSPRVPYGRFRSDPWHPKRLAIVWGSFESSTGHHWTRRRRHLLKSNTLKVFVSVPVCLQRQPARGPVRRA